MRRPPPPRNHRVHPRAASLTLYPSPSSRFSPSSNFRLHVDSLLSAEQHSGASLALACESLNRPLSPHAPHSVRARRARVGSGRLSPNFAPFVERGTATGPQPTRPTAEQRGQWTWALPR